ncbi:MAG: glycerol-3-phosphate 1-O-acyltransferase PlsY [Candidatus Binatia bacterium]
MDIALMLLFAYLLGSVPIGFLMGFISGVDVRQEGSGNVGATNVARVMGKGRGVLTLLGDAGKGYIPVFLSLQLELDFWVSAVTAFVAFLGHLYPVFLKFKGGKGVATALGVFLALTPMGAGILVLVFFLVVIFSRMVSLGSLVASVLAPIIFWYFSGSLYLVGLSFLIALFTIARHRDNIQRMISGVEPRFNF